MWKRLPLYYVLSYWLTGLTSPGAAGRREAQLDEGTGSTGNLRVDAEVVERPVTIVAAIVAPRAAGRRHIAEIASLARGGGSRQSARRRGSAVFLDNAPPHPPGNCTHGTQLG